MSPQQIAQLRIGDVIVVNYPNDDPNEPNEYKPRPVVLINKDLQTYHKVICITDIDNVDINNTKGLPIYLNTKDSMSMKLTKDSFINFEDVKTIPITSFLKLRGACSRVILSKIPINAL